MHSVMTLHAALCRTSKWLVAVLQKNWNHPGEAYVSFFFIRDPFEMSIRDPFEGPQEPVAMERRALWRG